MRTDSYGNAIGPHDPTHPDYPINYGEFPHAWQDICLTGERHRWEETGKARGKHYYQCADCGSKCSQCIITNPVGREYDKYDTYGT